MKKILFALLFISSLSGYSQMVSESFEEDLQRRHPKATAVTWLSGEEHYIAEFQEGDRSMKAFYTQDGQWVKTQMEINIEDIPEKVKANVGPEYKIIGAEKVVSSQSPLGNYLLQLEVAYDKAGNIIKQGS